MAAQTTAELLLHPVRLRIIQSLLGGRELTTTGLAAEIEEVPSATLYRHVAVLVDAGVLSVVSEHRVRGAVERTYALVVARAEVDPQALARMSADDHRRAFTAFVAGLLADFDRYLERHDPADLARDGVGYRQAALWLTDAELADLLTDLREVFAARDSYRPGGNRVRRIITTTVMPDAR